MVTLQENAVKFNSNLIVSHDGVVVEENTPDLLFDRPEQQRTKDFLDKIL